MHVRWLDLDAVRAAIKRPSCRGAFGLLGFGLSAFAWSYFPTTDARVVFASMFSLGIAVTCAWIGARVDAAERRRSRRRPRHLL